jgi:hypothetical protein
MDREPKHVPEHLCHPVGHDRRAAGKAKVCKELECSSKCVIEAAQWTAALAAEKWLRAHANRAGILRAPAVFCRASS